MFQRMFQYQWHMDQMYHHKIRDQIIEQRTKLEHSLNQSKRNDYTVLAVQYEHLFHNRKSQNLILDYHILQYLMSQNNSTFHVIIPDIPI